MQRVRHPLSGLLASLALCLGIGPAALAGPPTAQPAAKQVEVAAIRITHRDFPRPVRVLVRAGEMATIELDGRAVGLRVPAFDARSATIELIELERLRALETNVAPEYRETRLIEQRLVEAGRAIAMPSLGIELSVSRDELIRAPAAKDCDPDTAGAKDLGSGDQCCLRCRNQTYCATCVTADCGSCCAP